MESTAEYMNILRDYMAKNASKYSIIRMGIFGLCCQRGANRR